MLTDNVLNMQLFNVVKVVCVNGGQYTKSFNIMWLSTNTLCRLCTTPGALLSLSADSLHINVLQSRDKLVHNTSQKLCLWHEDDTESERIRGMY